ncbi:MAG: sugar ABC transporter permease [Treponema sp.]|jgi:raffinose/stachyose/melibiose transport system permease protein|nr:sugar ABC transporter permease [Treponema sp.]
MKNADVKRGLWILFFVFPAFSVVFVFIILPLFISLFNSFFSWKQLIRSSFTGLDNFKTLFFSYPYNERFFNALRNNVKWFLSTMIVQNSIGMLFGYMMSRKIPGQGFFKRIFFIPVLFSIVAVSFLWGLYLRPNGLVNEFLKLVHLDSLVHAWLGEEKLATFSIIAVNIWRWAGFPSLVFLAAVDAIPVDCIEAAYLDGTAEWKMFWRIVFPLIIPSVLVIMVLTIIGSLNVFEQIFTMTGPEGGPNYSTDTIGTMFYRTAFGGVDSGNPAIGIGSAIGVVIYLLTFGASIISIVVTRSREVEL